MRPDYREIAPQAQLQSIVKNFWVLEYEKSEPKKDYLLPSTLCYLFLVKTEIDFDAHFIQTNDVFTISNRFHLTSLNSLVEFTHKRMTVIGASIYPIYTSVLFREDPIQLVNRVKTDFDAPAIDLNIDSIEEIVCMIEADFTNRIFKNPIRAEIEEIYQRMIQEKRYKSSVEEIAQWIGYSSRHLINLFNKHLGISPKKFIKLIRFNHALELMNQPNSNLNLSEIAYELGYHDQSHFIKDFRNACGRTPKELMVDDQSMSQFFTLY